MDTILTKLDLDRSICAQVFINLILYMINVYILFKTNSNILKIYQDFIYYKNIPECLYQDLASEKITVITDLNKKIIIKDIQIETKHPNQNFIKALGTKSLKTIIETIINRIGLKRNFGHEYTNM